jgi:acetolactate synthase-1/2/3 large subunit
MIVITGQVPVHLIGNDAFQESDTVGITRPITKHNFLIKETEDIAQVFAEAFHIATTGRPGPVLIDVPKDVQIGEAEFSYPERPDIRGYKPRTDGHPKQIRKAAEMLTSARKPVIYVGGGAIISEASEEVRTLARKLNAPVTTTLMGLGAYPENDPLSLKMLGMHGTWYANTAVMMCDLLVCIGARFDDRVTGKLEEFSPHSKKIHIDIDPSSLNKNVRVDLPIVGDVKKVLQQLIPLVERADTEEWLQQIEEWKRDHPLTYANTIGLHEEGLEGVNRETVEKETDHLPLCAQYAIERIGQLTKGEAYVVTDVGQHQMWAAQWYGFSNPRSMITSGGLGTMGFGLPAAIGAQFAHPDRLVIDLDGDGSIRMNIGELETVTTYRLPLKVVVLNNFGDGMVKQWQKLFFKGRLSASDKSLHKKDFVKTAEADGFTWARQLSRKAEVEPTIEAFVRHDGPAFLEVIIDPDAGVYPMVGPGQAYEDMITGDFIPSRDEADPASEPDTSGMF